MSLLDLPNELLNEIGSHLSVSDCIDLSCCNWGLRQALLSQIFRTLVLNTTWWDSDAEFQALSNDILQKVRYLSISFSVWNDIESLPRTINNCTVTLQHLLRTDRVDPLSIQQICFEVEASMLGLTFLDDEPEFLSHLRKRRITDDELAFEVRKLFETLNLCPAFDLSFIVHRHDVTDPADPSNDLFINLLRAACSSPSVIKNIRVQSPFIPGHSAKELSDRKESLDKLVVRTFSSFPLLKTATGMELEAKELILDGSSHFRDRPFEMMLYSCWVPCQTATLNLFILFPLDWFLGRSTSKLTSLTLTNMLQYLGLHDIFKILLYFSPCPIQDFTFFSDGTGREAVEFTNSFATKVTLQCLYRLRCEGGSWKALQRLNVPNVRLKDHMSKKALLALTMEGVTVQSYKGHPLWTQASCSSGGPPPQEVVLP
ncbi:hypothetical protein BT69DRAFT_1379454 [Atractiella rhizophila]|nr:hypothetical protein BT69DRAFT_1379454 [Atractiella rhizophila]